MTDCSGKFYQQIPLGKAKDLTGQHFGKLVALFRVKTDKGSRKGAWLCQCECGNQKVVASLDLVSGNTRSCGCETDSIGENIIRELLLSSNYDFEEQVTFKDCLSPLGRPFRFDFGIYSNGELIRLIEYDGEFHYKTSNNSSAEKLQIRKNYDKIKTEYCLSHSIPLIRIPYWERNNITLTTLLDETYLIK